MRLAWVRASQPAIKVTEPSDETNPDDLPPASLAVAVLEPTLRRALLRTLSTHANGLDWDAITEACARHAVLDVDRLLQPERQQALLHDVLAAKLATGFQRGVTVGAVELREAGGVVKQLAVDLEAVNDEAVEWAAANAAALVVQITEAQREALRQLIARANAEGLTPDQTARRVRQIVGLRADQELAIARFAARLVSQGIEASVVARRTERYADAQRRRRAQTIARTELVTASNAGQQALWGEAVRIGAIDRARLYKKWIVTDDERLCTICEGLGEEAPVPIDATFPGGYRYPTAHTNCRCALGLVSVRQPPR